MTDDELREVLVAATPGPWLEGSMDADRGAVWIGGRNVQDGGFVYPYLAMTLNWPENYLANATLIAEAPTLAARVLSDAEKIAKLKEALRPLARLEIPKRPQGNAGAYSIRHSDIARAAAALAELD